jgi:hypothetical protein
MSDNRYYVKYAQATAARGSFEDRNSDGGNMRQKLLPAAVALVVVLLVGAPTAFATTNLVSNGSFETGDFTGWTEGGNFEFTMVVAGAFGFYKGAEDGLFYTVMGPEGGDATLSQTLATTKGAQYTFSFWFASVGDDPSEFLAFWNSNLLSLFNPNTGPAWTQFSFTVMGTGRDTMWFSFDDDPGYMALDNVSVTQNVSTTPEPGSLWLLGSGLLCMGGLIRRKIQANS